MFWLFPHHGFVQRSITWRKDSRRSFMFIDNAETERSRWMRPQSIGQCVSDIAICLAGAMVGAGLMYFFDPISGRRRRALVRDKFVRYSNEAQELAGDVSQYAADKGRGLAAEARAWMGEGDVPDESLVERVR